MSAWQPPKGLESAPTGQKKKGSKIPNSRIKYKTEDNILDTAG